jgi:hypothetical protein
LCKGGCRPDGSAFGVPTIRLDLKPLKKDKLSRQGTRVIFHYFKFYKGEEEPGAYQTVFSVGKGRFEQDWKLVRSEEEVYS